MNLWQPITLGHPTQILSQCKLKIIVFVNILVDAPGLVQIYSATLMFKQTKTKHFSPLYRYTHNVL